MTDREIFCDSELPCATFISLFSKVHLKNMHTGRKGNLLIYLPSSL